MSCSSKDIFKNAHCHKYSSCALDDLRNYNLVAEVTLKHNVLLFDVPTILIRHFVLFFSIFSQKEKFYVKRRNNSYSPCMIFFFHILCRMNIFLRVLLFIKAVSQGIWVTRNLLQYYPIFNLIFSLLKKGCKNEYNCPSEMCLSDIITSSSISIIILCINFFVSLEDWKLPQYSHKMMK